jgi:glucose/arabinose dehydrogenase
MGGTGIRVGDGQLYVDAKTVILRYPLPATAMAPSGAPDTIVGGLPTDGHDARNFVLDGSGGLIVNFGSLTNSCQRKDRAKGSPGVDPCVERDQRAGLWRFDATRAGQKAADGEHFAVGIRNSVALDVAPDGQVWVAQHGRDQLFQNWGTMYTEKQSAENPSEELLRVNRNDDFGWPYCYHDAERNRMVLAPEYGGDGGNEVGRCAQVKGPVATFPAHWAPMALLFYTGSQFPARYRDGVFIAFHGSWNRAPEPQGGYNVVFQPLRDGQPSGAYAVFATGFAGGTVTPAGAAHRPAGLAQGPDGSIYVSDDKGGTIYRIGYRQR